ncbi:MAG: hypothetical protein ACOZAO_03875 [Patescibacteria group bacterium]
MSEQNPKLCVAEFINSIKGIEDSKVLGVIRTGELDYSDFVPNWSDIDLFVILEEMNITAVKTITRLTKSLSKKHNIHIGLALMTSQEYYSTTPEVNCLKNLLMKKGFSYGRNNIEWGNLTPCELNLPNKLPSMIREVNYFKAYMRNGLRDLNEDELLRRIIKCAHYILLCSLLAEYPLLVDTKPNKALSEELFHDFGLGFSIYDHISAIKKEFDTIVDAESEAYVIADYLEKFLVYFYRRTTNV